LCSCQNGFHVKPPLSVLSISLRENSEEADGVFEAWIETFAPSPFPWT
jgi:hypothetical protein